jgi:hypothetical protein
MSFFERRRVFENFVNPVYVAGQGGILVFSAKLQQVENAGVVSIGGTVGTVAYTAQVRATGLATGTVGTTPPAGNGIQVFIQQIAGTLGPSEAPSGTLTGVTLSLYEEGV